VTPVAAPASVADATDFGMSGGVTRLHAHVVTSGNHIAGRIEQ
jgi:hypothetical protein